MEQAFEEYLKEFDMKDPDINYKYYHSYRVAKLSDMLAKNLNQEDKLLAHIIGQYHDIGRFTQDKMYNVYDDMQTFDHGDYAVEVLFKQKLIKKIPVEKKYYHIIEKAIKNHNKHHIEDHLDEKELFHSKLIRDADKLDILCSLSDGIHMKNNVFKETFPIDEIIKKQFFNQETINLLEIKKLKNESEKLVTTLALVFDFNFKEAIDYLKENKIIDKIYNNRIKNKEYYKEYFDRINEYLEKR